MTTRTRLLTSALLAGLLVPTVALAGTLQVRDPGDALPALDEANLREAARAWPFDARVVVSSEMSSRAEFDRYIGAQVASANMVVVGVDPAHHFTSVHFGTGTRIARERFSAIENTGDGWFRQGQWRGGIEAILASASSAVGSGSPGTSSDSPMGSNPLGNRNESAPSFPWGLVLLGLGGVAVAAMVFRAARNRAQVGPMGGDPYRAQQYPPGYNPNGPGGYGPGGGPGYAPQQGGMGGLGAGVLGAGVGGLAGYALGSAMAHREDHQGGGDGGGGGFGAGSDNSGGSGFDAGGASSGWDAGGGGGGDFGGGGGGDAGGGGGGGDW
jgi:hypothetical protein